MRRVPSDDVPVLAWNGRHCLSRWAHRGAARNQCRRLWDRVVPEQLASYLKPENLGKCRWHSIPEQPLRCSKIPRDRVVVRHGLEPAHLACGKTAALPME